jgi:hypothetical protein
VTTPTPVDPHDDAKSPPPVLGSWRALYTVVAAELIAIILLCGWLSRIGR